MKVKTLAVIIGLLASLVTGVFAMETRFNQQNEVMNVSDTVKLQSIAMHDYHYYDMSLRIAYLEGIPGRTATEDRELSLYKSRREKILIVMERLGE